MTPAERWNARTNQKLRFARVHLNELVAMQIPGHGHDFERAHLEGTLFQLIGACDVFRMELHALAGRNSVLLGHLDALRDDRASWLGELVALRNSSTHRNGVPLAFYVGGEASGKVAFKHPDTLIEFPDHARDTLAMWLANLQMLFAVLRENAKSEKAVKGRKEDK